MNKENASGSEQELFNRGTRLQLEVLKRAKGRGLTDSARLEEWTTNGKAEQFRQWVTAQLKENPYVADEELIWSAINYFF